ncbi:MAG: OmpA/MotB family protein [Armatimonadota bacterium]
MRARLSAGKPAGEGGHDSGGPMRWLLTYADMITLLMAFFIMLYSMSILNLARFQEVALSIRSGFGEEQQGRGLAAHGASRGAGIRPLEAGGSVAGVPYSLIRGLKSEIQRQGLEGKVLLGSDERGLVITLLSDRVLFPIGEARIRPEAQEILKGIASLIRETPNDVRVEGHTCSLPVRSGPFATNWELSTARATEVVRFLIQQGIPAKRLSAAGYADQHPAASNASKATRVRNRRVEIVLLRPAMGADPTASVPR